MPIPPNPKPLQTGSYPTPSHPDILIVGAGIIGLSLALELDRRGALVTVIEAHRALQQASTAAAGMLAVDDPHNPPQLLALAQLSAALYPAFLRRIESLSGLAVPFQTATAIQYLANGRATSLHEHSLDPRQLAAALLAAIRATRIDLRERTPLQSTADQPGGKTIYTANGDPLSPDLIVFATGAWASLHLHLQPPIPIAPRKGQMLRVALPPALRDLREVHRSEHIYIVPRTLGPQAGSALIGATVEDAGFDTTTHAASLAQLRARAAHLLPALADPAAAPQLEDWAGLRSATPDHLPILGRLHRPQQGPHHTQGPAAFIAAGHFRNGILLAPATAVLLADLIENKPPSLDLTPFSPQRFPSK